MSPASYHFTMAEDPVKLPFADEAFDLVTSVGVLEHVRIYGGEERLSLGELFRVLKPGGRFICVHLPSVYTWVEGVGRLFRMKDTHKYRFLMRDVEALMRDSGFVLETVKRYGAFPRNPLASLPRGMRNSVGLANSLDRADRLATLLIRPLAENIAFVARKAA
jgi:SAM-dependent methyltransferase